MHRVLGPVIATITAPVSVRGANRLWPRSGTAAFTVAQNDLTMRPVTGHEERNRFTRLPDVRYEALGDERH